MLLGSAGVGQALLGEERQARRMLELAERLSTAQKEAASPESQLEAVVPLAEASGLLEAQPASGISRSTLPTLEAGCCCAAPSETGWRDQRTGASGDGHQAALSASGIRRARIFLYRVCSGCEGGPTDTSRHGGSVVC